METIYNLRLFIGIAILVLCGFLLGYNPEKVRGWREYAILLIGGMLISAIIHW